MNEARELAKAENVLGQVERYLTAHNESMAALHLSERVVPSPLTASVINARMDLQRALGRASEGTSNNPDESGEDNFRELMGKARSYGKGNGGVVDGCPKLVFQDQRCSLPVRHAGACQ